MALIVAGPPEANDFLQAIVRGIMDGGVGAHLHLGPVGTIAPDLWARCEVIVTIGAVTAQDMKRSAALHSIVLPTVGYDTIDVAAATRMGILVANGEVAENVESMAEATMLMMLAALYDLPGSMGRMNQTGDWRGGTRSARMLQGKTVGIVGYGKIARALIERLAGWRTTILVHSRTAPNGGAQGVTFVSLDDLLAASDCVVVLSALTPERHHMLDAERLARMKDGAILVNTARGGLIDEAALRERLRGGRLSRVALDVFETEPLPPDSEWRTMPDAILTPHMIGHTHESMAAIMATASRNGLTAWAGDVPAPTVNGDVLARWRRRKLEASGPNSG